MNFAPIDSVELMSWKENADVTASKMPTPLASYGAKTTVPSGAATAPENRCDELPTEMLMGT